MPFANDLDAPVLWFTGLSGAGKSTIASGVLKVLHDRGVAAESLDGDEIRNELSPDLGFSKADRDLQVSRLGYLAHLLSRNSVIVLVSAISPYRESRDKALSRSPRSFEIHVHADLEVLVARDTKGLYRRAIAGEISGLTGYDDPYEAPIDPDLVIDTAQTSLEDSIEAVLDLLDQEAQIDKSA
ncbi:MAG: adenylyl-sulfate kinase [Acidimicrobiaceae bacterium]|nr:adenylyl-sulfate kinase [Acidimicrobiaceae bacterium]